MADTLRSQDESQYLNESRERIAENFNQRAFEVRHSLTGHPLFELPRLRELARFLLGKREYQSVTCLTGSKERNSSWDDLDQAIDQVDDCLRELENEGRAWIILKNIVLDPDYKAVMDPIIRQVAEAADSVGDGITWPEPYLFVSSPTFVTPYHIDHEAGLLLQIVGKKKFAVFPHDDRSVLTPKQIEQFYMGDMSAAKLTPESEGKGALFDLVPGNGVCFPSLAGHWAEVGDTYSVSLSIGFAQESCNARAPVYQANHYLRKLGLSPAEPGRSRVRDAIKRAPIRWVSKRHPESMGEMLRSGIHRISALTEKLRA